MVYVLSNSGRYKPDAEASDFGAAVMVLLFGDHIRVMMSASNFRDVNA